MGSLKRLIDLVLNGVTDSYRIYKYLLPDKAHLVRDVRIPPMSLDYTIDVNPKLQKKVETIDPQGSLTYVEWWAYSNDGVTPEEEVLKVTIEYTYADDADVEAAKTVLSRKVTRQWIREDGTYKSWTQEEIDNGESDLKIRIKHYPDYRTRKKVGQGRRENIIALGEERFITLLTILVCSGDQELAEKLGKSILRKYASEYTEFYNVGDAAFMESALNDDDPTDLLDAAGVVISAGMSFNNVLDTVVPPSVNLGQGDIPFNAIVPGSQGLSIRQFISEKYRGNI